MNSLPSQILNVGCYNFKHFYMEISELTNPIIGAIATGLAGWLTAILNKRFKEVRTEIESSPESSSNEIKRFAKNLKIWQIFSVIAFLLGVVITFYFFYVDNKRTTNEKLSEINSSSNELAKKGLSKKTYVLPNIVMNVNLNKLKDSMEANITISYSIIYVDTLKNGIAFNDGYILKPGVRFFNLTGSEALDTTATTMWNYDFKVRPGLHKIVTSSYTLRYPNNTSQTSKSFWETLNDSEEVFQYHNDDDDIIGELTIVISSDSLVFRNAQAKQGSLSKPKESTDVRVFKPGQNTKSTFVARFENLRDHDNAQIKVQW